jgi:hypothetical protein
MCTFLPNILCLSVSLVGSNSLCRCSCTVSPVLKEKAERREGQTINSSAIHLMMPTALSAGIPKNEDPEKDDNGLVVFNDMAFSQSVRYQL